MKDFLNNSLYFGTALCIAGYALGMWIRKRFKLCFLNPLLLSIIFVIAVVQIIGIDYESFSDSSKYLSYLLTPATVCLAVPLYQQLNLLKEHLMAVFCAIFAGVISSMGSVLAMAYLFGLSHEYYVTLLPKSITTAIGMGVSDELGGITTITVAVIIVTGVLGNIIGEVVCRLFHIYEPIAVGLALGTSAHAVGTTKAMELGEIEGAMSSLSIAVAGLMTVAAASFFAGLL